MSVTFANMEDMVLRGVESAGNTIFDTTETAEAVNNAIQSTVKRIKQVMPEYFIATADIAFTASDYEKDLPTTFTSLINAEDGNKLKIPITVLRHKDQVQSPGEYFIYFNGSDSKWKLRRRTADSAITITIWYDGGLARMTHGATTALDILSQPGLLLIQTEAELELLSNRGRRSRRKEVLEQRRIVDLLEHVASIQGNASEEMVVFVE